MKFNETKVPEKTEQNFPVVGIGASAGGLDAFKKILNTIPLDSGMAYVIVQHLSPDNPDNLIDILSQNTEIPVHEIINNINFAPNHIYIIPDNNNLVTENGVLKLHTRTRGERKNNSIDIFFESLAEVHKTFAVGVILSGTGFDGTFGLKKIKELGGVAIAQEPETALFKGMPQSAIDADIIDYILSPEHIPEQLLLIQKSYTATHGYSEEEQIPKSEEEILHQILGLVFLRTGNDFNHYKQTTIRRRIARRMVIVHRQSLEDYFNLLRNDKTEQDLLFNDFVISVSYFFRDSIFFESLPKIVFPQLIQNTPDNNLRIWVAGCGNGEEAYSIAISIHEHLTLKNNKDIKVQIFASDISEKCINKARTAIYSAQDVQHISPSRLQNYFTKRDGHYHINKVIRDMCIFAVHNLIKDPPFARIELVSCRNVLSYFDSFLQNKVLSYFHYSLKEKGILFLGKSETTANAENLFDEMGKEEKIYVRKYAAKDYIPETFKLSHLNTCNKTGIPEKFTNEELLSFSEEIQAMKEELAASTEELQSNNEELKCMYEELTDRQGQLISLRNYSESIFKTIREPLLIIDRDFFIKSANPSFYKYFQTTEEETEGRSFFEFGDCQWDIPEFKELIFKMIRENGSIEDFKVDTTCKGIGKKIMMVNAQRILNTKPSGMILLALEDITDLVVANEQLDITNSELQKYNEQLEAFSSAASHDLQEPLRKIHMFCKRIIDSEKNLSESSKHNLERMVFAVTNMSQLIADLIDYSRINFVEKEYKKTDLNVLLKKTIGDIKYTILEKNAIITILPFPQLNVIPYQIQQLFTNLILNSIKYTKEGNIPEIKIETRQPSIEEILEIGGNKDINYIKICISDNGIGFSQEYASKIFAPFYRLHNNDQYHGSGLGLTLVKKIVTNHNGFITVSSKINQGTTIYIYLPL